MLEINVFSLLLLFRKVNFKTVERIFIASFIMTYLLTSLHEQPN